MNQGRGTNISLLSKRPKGGTFEPKRDCFDRDSFCMPEVSSLAALSMPPEDEHRQTYRMKPRDRTGTPANPTMLT